MKVVLFCGGLGMRMRADNQSLPKPMMPIGSRPVLWHVMRTTPTSAIPSSFCVLAMAPRLSGLLPQLS